jgi:hypothetical protein
VAHKLYIRLLAGERQDSESNRAVQACNDYLRLGVHRTLSKVEGGYPKGSLGGWSIKYRWAERAEQYDAQLEMEKNRAVEERRATVMQDGLSLDFERVGALKKLAGFLEGQIYETEEVDGETRYPKLWLRDYKTTRLGDFLEVFRFNAPLIDQYRGLLDDIARETGGRKNTTEISGPGGKAIELTNLTDQQLADLATKGMERHADDAE